MEEQWRDFFPPGYNNVTVTGAGPDNSITLSGPTDDPVELCFSLNRRYQDVLNIVLCRLQSMLENNMEEQKRIEDEESVHVRKSGGLCLRSRKPITLFAAPYFRDVRGCVPPENEDTVMKKRSNDMNAYVMPPKPWTNHDYLVLTRAVYKSALQISLAPLLNLRAFNQEKMKKQLLSEEKSKEVQDVIKKVDADISECRKMSFQEHVALQKDKIDWLKISSVNMEGTRSPEECQCMWNNFVNPKVNKRKFSKKEDNSLRKLAKEHKFRNWDAIAMKMNTNRTAIQCLERYQSQLNSNLLKCYWTPEEDEHLMRVINACRIGEYIPWHQVTYYMVGRSRVQVTNRWTRSIDPQIRVGTWSTEEDALLFAAVLKYGYNWTKVSDLTPGRSSYMCRERYVNNLVPGMNTGSWTLEEDRILLKSVAKYGEKKWAKIVNHLPGRTDSMISQRAYCLKKHNRRLYAKFTQAGAEVNPELLKRQFAPSKPCPTLNKIRRELQDQAVSAYLAALVKYSGVSSIEDAKDTNGDIQKPSVSVLHKMREELLNSEHVKKLRELKPCYRSLEMHLQREMERNYEEMDSSSESDGSETEEEIPEAVIEPEEQVTEEDMDKVDKELKFLFSARAAAGVKPFIKKRISRSSREAAEYDIVKNHIFELFDVKEENATDDKEIIFTHRGIDYKKTIERVLDIFVMPTCQKGELPVFPPNVVNMTGMLLCLVLRKLLDTSLAEINEKSIDNFRTILKDIPGFERRCHFCRTMPKEQAISTSDDKQKCQCDLIKMFRERLLLLRKRFLSVFFWPGLLSKIPLTAEQEAALMLRYPRDVPGYVRPQTKKKRLSNPMARLAPFYKKLRIERGWI